jgi:hypothetical protein
MDRTLKAHNRKEVALILAGAVLAVTSFGINWKISSALDQRSYAIDEQLQDIDRFLTFAEASVLQAFELSSSSKIGLAISQLMYFQILKDDPDEAAIRTYHTLVAHAIKNKASAVTCLHAAATGKTIDGIDRDRVMELADAEDHAKATWELAALFAEKLKLYQDVSEEKVKLRRELIVTKNQLASQRNVIGNFAKLIQLLAILIILAKDLVVAKSPDSDTPEIHPIEHSNQRRAA